MRDRTVKPAPLHWLVGGVLLGLLQVVAVASKKPLGVSTQFVVADAKILASAAPEYAASHPVISQEKYQKLGYGWWLDIGIVLGALLAALAAGRWRVRSKTLWWRANGRGGASRLGVSFAAGVLILFGARMAHGCTSGAFASGWAQLSASAVPFTIALFGFAVLTARLLHPNSPDIQG